MHRTRTLGGALLGAVIWMSSCAGSPPGASSRGDGSSPDDTPGPTSMLGDRADAIMRPAFTPTPRDLEQCVGGVAVVVTPAEELVRGWGATAPGGATAPDATTLFQIGSLTKVFTGLALARLVEEGVVTPGTSPGDLLGADLSDVTPTWPPLRDLITHHAGLPDFPGNLVDRDGDGARDPGIDARSPAAGYSRTDLRAALAASPPAADAPYLYSNVGLGLVGLALQDHLGLPSHDAALRQLVTEDLGMRDTWGTIAAVPSTERGRLATGNAVTGTGRVPGVPAEMGVLASAGEIVSSGADLRLFLRAVTGLARTPLAGAIARATAPIADGPDGRAMGYAVEIEEADGLALYRKGGNTPSFAAYLIWSTEPAVGVAVLTNCGGFRSVVDLARTLHEAARAQ